MQLIIFMSELCKLKNVNHANDDARGEWDFVRDVKCHGWRPASWDFCKRRIGWKSTFEIHDTSGVIRIS